jgi:hypothetical protein
MLEYGVSFRIESWLEWPAPLFPNGAVFVSLLELSFFFLSRLRMNVRDLDGHKVWRTCGATNLGERTSRNFRRRQDRQLQ